MSKYIAEFIGTFALVFFGTGSIIVNQFTAGSVGLIGIALAFGFVIMAMIYVFGPISGAHINPAVTISLAIGKLIPKREATEYVIAQILGAILASFVLSILFPANLTLGMTTPSGGMTQSFMMEVIATFFMMMAILGVSQRKAFSPVVGLIIGMTVIGLILVAGPVSGGSFNPARSIGPAVVAGKFTALWMYLVAPTLGAILATVIWQFLDKSIVEDK